MINFLWPVQWYKDFSRARRLAKMYGEVQYLEEEDEMDIKRLVSTDLLEVYDTHLLLNKITYVRCIVGGISDRQEEALPDGLTEEVHDRIMDLANDGARIEICSGVIKIPRTVVSGDLDNTYVSTNTDKKNLENNNSDTLENVRLDENKKEIVDIFKNLQKNQFNAFDVSYIITIMGDEAEVKKTETEVIGVLNSEIIENHIPLNFMLQAFIASRPYPKSERRFQIRTDSETAAILCPTIPMNSTIDETGILFGTDIKTGAQVVIDTKKKKSRHFKGFGSTGSGKSFTFSELLRRHITFYNSRGCVITPKHEEDNFIALARHYGERGTVVFLGEDGDAFNPCQIPIDENLMGNNPREYARALHRRVRNLKAAFGAWFDLSDGAKGYLEDTIRWLYEDAGIVRNKPETFKRETWPKLEKLWDKWDSDSTDDTLSQQTRNIAASLAMKARPISRNGSLNYFNRDPEKPIDYSSMDLIVFDISGVDEEIQDFVNVIVTGYLGDRFRYDANRESIIIVDEARIFLRNPSLNTFIKDGVALGRALNVWMWLITQNPSDFEKANSDDEIRMNIPISVVMGADVDASNIDLIKKYFNLSESDAELLIGCQPGEGLLIVNGEIYHLRFEPSNEEYAVIKGLDIEESVIPSMHFDGYRVKPEYQCVVDKSHLIFSKMLEGDESKLKADGWIKKPRQPTIKGRGSTSVWYKEGEIKLSSNNTELVNRQDIGSMTFEHMLGVSEIWFWLLSQGVKCEVDHTGNDNRVDIVFWVGNKKYAIEWERAGSHTFEQLKDKLQYMLTNFEDCRVACSGDEAEYSTINKAISDAYMAPRGNTLMFWLERTTSGTSPDNFFDEEINLEEFKDFFPSFVFEEVIPRLTNEQKVSLVSKLRAEIAAGKFEPIVQNENNPERVKEKIGDQQEEQGEAVNPLISVVPEQIEVS